MPLMTALNQARGRLEERLTHYSKPKLLISVHTPSIIFHDLGCGLPPHEG